jgi:antitoxin VapB
MQSPYANGDQSGMSIEQTQASTAQLPAPRTARLFRNGANQAVRLPRDLEIDADEVLIHREGNRIVLTPKPRSWDSYFVGARRLGDDFPDTIDDALPQPREDI